MNIAFLLNLNNYMHMFLLMELFFSIHLMQSEFFFLKKYILLLLVLILFKVRFQTRQKDDAILLEKCLI